MWDAGIPGWMPPPRSTLASLRLSSAIPATGSSAPPRPRTLGYFDDLRVRVLRRRTVNGTSEVTQLRLVVTAPRLRPGACVLPGRPRPAPARGLRISRRAGDHLEAGRATLEIVGPHTPPTSTPSRSDGASPGTSVSPSRSTTPPQQPPSWPPPGPKSSPSRRRSRGSPSIRGCTAWPGCSSLCSRPSIEYTA